MTLETIGQPKYACHIRFQYMSITSPTRNKQATNTGTVITFCIVNLPTSRMYSSIPALESRWLHSLPTYFFTSSEPLNTRCLMFACTAASIAFRPYKYWHGTHLENQWRFCLHDNHSFKFWMLCYTKQNSATFVRNIAFTVFFLCCWRFLWQALSTRLF